MAANRYSITSQRWHRTQWAILWTWFVWSAVVCAVSTFDCPFLIIISHIANVDRTLFFCVHRICLIKINTIQWENRTSHESSGKRRTVMFAGVVEIWHVNVTTRIEFNQIIIVVLSLCDPQSYIIPCWPSLFAM